MTTFQRPSRLIVLPAIFLTVVSTLIFSVLFVVAIERHHRLQYNLPPVTVRGFFGDTWKEPATVTFTMLDKNEWLTLVIGIALFALVHPVVGRITVVLADGLCRIWDKLFFSKPTLGQWSYNGSLLFGASWMLTWVAIPVLIVGVVLGAAYRALWGGQYEP
jgi:hypothetical protein